MMAESLVWHETADYSFGNFPEGQEDLVLTSMKYGDVPNLLWAGKESGCSLPLARTFPLWVPL